MNNNSTPINVFCITPFTNVCLLPDEVQTLLVTELTSKFENASFAYIHPHESNNQVFFTIYSYNQTQEKIEDAKNKLHEFLQTAQNQGYIKGYVK
jgi:DNA-directed RNA polymerase subunit L